MEMITIPVTVPKAMAPYMDWKDNGMTMEQKAMLLYPMIRDCVISHGRAAEILEIPKWDLIELYDSMGIPYLNQSPADLDEEIAGFHVLKAKKVQ